METVQIKKTEKNEIFIGTVTKNLIDNEPKLTDQEKLILKNETIKILSNCCPSKSKDPLKSTGLVYGYVQSGKTLSFTTLCALAKDNGYRIAIIFTGIKKNLLKQTKRRLEKDLKVLSSNSEKFKLINSPSIKKDDHNNIKNNLKLSDKPLIILTIMKNSKGLSNLTEIFNNEELKKDINERGVLIIDDEADQASLNTKAKTNSKKSDWENDELSSTYANILELRDSLNVHTYLEYTATPQGLLGIAQKDQLSPDFHVLLTPGEQYTGGEIFFKTNKKELIEEIPKEEVFHPKQNNLSKIPDSLEKALDYYLIGASIEVKILKNIKQVSMMIHCDKLNVSNEKFYKWVVNFRKKRINILEKEENDPLKIKLISKYKDDFELRKNNYEENIDFDKVIIKLKDILYDTNIEKIIKQNQFSANDFAANKSHIIVGADKLNRGFTVEGLMVTYLSRNSKTNNNADTIEQRCRFFGYKKKYLKSCKVFLPEELIFDYINYVEHEEDLRNRLLESDDTKSILREFLLSNKLNLTRSNILSKNVQRNHLSGKWETIHNLDYFQENSRYFNLLYSENKHNSQSVKKLFTNYKSNGALRNHKALKISKNKVLEIFDNYRVKNDNVHKKQTFKDFIYKSDKIDFYLIFMGENQEMKRQIVQKNSEYEIDQIHSGVDYNSADIYPGDNRIKKNDSLCIQVYNISAKKEDDSKINNRKFHAISIWFPENNSKSTVTIY